MFIIILLPLLPAPIHDSDNHIGPHQRYNLCDPTSLNIDSELWREVKKMAIDKGVTATEYLERALKEKLYKDKSRRK